VILAVTENDVVHDCVEIFGIIGTLIGALPAAPWTTGLPRWNPQVGSGAALASDDIALPCAIELTPTTPMNITSITTTRALRRGPIRPYWDS
jgi:hypothetical protein